MASSLHPSEMETDSVASTPRSENFHAFSHDPRVRFMCSFGGKILPRPHDNQLRYVGGDTRIVAVHRSITYSTLLTKLSKLSGIIDVNVKYQLPNEDLDALISVTTDEDVENMMDEYDRLLQNQNPRSARLRLFLFSKGEDSRTSSISSLLDSSTNREHWFFDALNSGNRLERGRSEASSIVSEVPDYLFGLENSDETQPSRDQRVKNRTVLQDSISASDPGSPAPVVSSPYCSTSSAVPVIPSIPDLPPVKTKPEIQEPIMKPKNNNPDEGFSDKTEPTMVQPRTGYPSNQPAIHYIPETHYSGPSMQHLPVYYVPGMVQSGNVNVPVQQVQMRHYVQQYQVPMSQMPVGYPGAGQGTSTGIGQGYTTSGAPMRPIGGLDPRGFTEGVNVNHMQQVYYHGHGVRSAGPVPGYPEPMVMGGDELQRNGSDVKNRRLSQS